MWSVPGPYRSFETAGAWIVLAFAALWSSRKYLIQVAGWTIRGQPPETTADEPMTYRAAVGGMLVGGAILVLALSYAGMTSWIAILFLLIYIVYAVAIARIRAEIGPPAHDAEWIGPEMMLLNSLGARTVGQRNIALFSRTYWMSRAYRSHPRRSPTGRLQNRTIRWSVESRLSGSNGDCDHRRYRRWILGVSG